MKEYIIYSGIVGLLLVFVVLSIHNKSTQWFIVGLQLGLFISQVTIFILANFT